MMLLLLLLVLVAFKRAAGRASYHNYQDNVCSENEITSLEKPMKRNFN